MKKHKLFAKLRKQVDTGLKDEAHKTIDLLRQSKLSPIEEHLLDRFLLSLNSRHFIKTKDAGFYSSKKTFDKADICIITPANNSERFISKTISSILVQDESIKIRYHIQDACSTDGTKKIALQYINTVNSSHPNIYLSISIEEDRGMYDAILKGFEYCSDHIAPNTWMTWINSDDQLTHDATRILREISIKYDEDVRFVVGQQFVRDDLGSHYRRTIPVTRETLSQGLHDGIFLPFVQQEGTFWKSTIWHKNLEAITSEFGEKRISNDYVLWSLFARNHNVFALDQPLGIFFRRHNEIQLSSDLNKYQKEIDSYISRTDRSSAFANICSNSEGLRVYMLEVNRKTLEPTLAKRSIRFFAPNKFAIDLKDNNTILSANSSDGISCSDVMRMEYHSISSYMPYVSIPSLSKPVKEFGIALFTHTRVDHVDIVLRSISRQGFIDDVVVFVDGHQGKAHLKQKTSAVIDLCKKYGISNIIARNGLLGFRKSVLDGLTYMIKQFNSFLVLEDDCYPVNGGIKAIQDLLYVHMDDDRVFSVYGHRFGISDEDPCCSRFQGWGWATSRNKLIGPLSKLIYLYSLPENEYLEFTSAVLSEAVIDMLDITSPRKPTHCLKSFYAWDETLALICVLEGLVHVPTEMNAVINFGLDYGESDFDSSVNKFRKPPFNMKSLQEIRELDALLQ